MGDCTQNAHFLVPLDVVDVLLKNAMMVTMDFYGKWKGNFTSYIWMLWEKHSTQSFVLVLGTECQVRREATDLEQQSRTFLEDMGVGSKDHVLSDPRLYSSLFFSVRVFKVHPGRLTWNLQINHLERKMIFLTSMIMFHVNLPGCLHFFLIVVFFPKGGMRWGVGCV